MASAAAMFWFVRRSRYCGFTWHTSAHQFCACRSVSEYFVVQVVPPAVRCGYVPSGSNFKLPSDWRRRSRNAFRKIGTFKGREESHVDDTGSGGACERSPAGRRLHIGGLDGKCSRSGRAGSGQICAERAVRKKSHGACRERFAPRSRRASRQPSGQLAAVNAIEREIGASPFVTSPSFPPPAVVCPVVAGRTNPRLETRRHRRPCCRRNLPRWRAGG